MHPNARLRTCGAECPLAAASSISNPFACDETSLNTHAPLGQVSADTKVIYRGRSAPDGKPNWRAATPMS